MASEVKPEDNRFTKDLSDMSKTIAYGADMNKVLLATSGGRKNFTNDILFSIKREYFTWKQFALGMYWSMIVGAFIGVLVMSLVVEGNLWNPMEFPAMSIGVFVLSFGLADLTSEIEAFTGLKTCTKRKIPGSNQYVAEMKFIGRPCFTDYECTSANHLKSWQIGMCGHHPSSLVSFKKKVITPMITIVGAILVIWSFTTTDDRPKTKDVLQSAMYGIFGGTVSALTFSSA